MSGETVGRGAKGIFDFTIMEWNARRGHDVITCLRFLFSVLEYMDGSSEVRITSQLGRVCGGCV